MTVDILKAGRHHFDIGDLVAKAGDAGQHRQLVALRAGQFQVALDPDGAGQSGGNLAGMAFAGGD